MYFAAAWDLFVNLGDGTFASRIRLKGPEEAVVMARGDFNRDGHPDLVFTTQMRSIAVVFGDGAGGFAAPITYPTGVNALAVVVSDFNHDGYPDLVVTNAEWVGTCPPGLCLPTGLGRGTVNVFINRKGGTFDSQSIYAAGNGTAAIAAGDLDGDGAPDIAATNSVDDTLSVFYNAGDGTFGPPTTYPNAGSGTAALGEPYPGNGGGVAAADFDGDGHVDIAVVRSSPAYRDGAVLLFVNAGDGTFRLPRTFPITGSPRGFAVADYAQAVVAVAVLDPGAERRARVPPEEVPVTAARNAPVHRPTSVRSRMSSSLTDPLTDQGVRPLGGQSNVADAKLAQAGDVLCAVAGSVVCVRARCLAEERRQIIDGSYSKSAGAFLATTLAAAVAGSVWPLIEWFTRGKPTVLGFCSGVVAGLVVITPAAGFVSATGAVIIGVLAGVLPYLACTKLKQLLKYDDALDTFGVHGVGGTLGALVTGFLASPEVNGNLNTNLAGIVGHTLWLEQLEAMGVTILLALLGTVVLAHALKAVLGLRPDLDNEEQGLDILDHGEAGYHMDEAGG